MVYLDASAIVKLIVKEPESRALAAYLRNETHRVTSRLATVEVIRAAGRHGGIDLERAFNVLGALDLIELSEGVAMRASMIAPTDLRTLDAIHLASALELRSELTAFIAYDERLALAARGQGLPVAAPA